MCLIYKLMKQYQSVVILSTTVINMIHDSCLHLFVINCLDRFQVFFLKEFLKGFKSKFSQIEIWFTDQNSKALEKEDNINITLVINESVKYKR